MSPPPTWFGPAGAPTPQPDRYPQDRTAVAQNLGSSASTVPAADVTEATVRVRFDPDHGVDTSYGYVDGQLVVTFGKAGDVGPGILRMVLRRQVGA